VMDTRSSSDTNTVRRRTEADAYFQILQTIARFPITDPAGNMDAVNMRLIAQGAIQALVGSGVDRWLRLQLGPQPWRRQPSSERR